MASKSYPVFHSRRNAGGFNIGTSSIRALLVKSTYTYSDAHEFVAAVTGHEVSGGSYARQTLADVVQSTNTTLDRVSIDASDPTFPGVPAQDSDIGGVIYYVFGTNDADSYLISFQDAPDVTANGSDIGVTIPALGIFYDQY